MALFGGLRRKESLLEGQLEEVQDQRSLSDEDEGSADSVQEAVAGHTSADEPGLLTCALKLAPHLKGLLGDEIGLYITDLYKNVYCEHGIVKLAAKKGDPNKEGGTAMQTIRSRQRTVARVGAEVYGMPYIGRCYPLIEPETGELVGTMITVTPIERQEKLVKAAEKVETSTSNLAMATTDLSATAEELAATAENLNNYAHSISEEIKKTDEIVELINRITEQTHLLGLNAAIEAARVGEAGRGFNVVAGEIRKLSRETQQSVKSITQTLQYVQKSIMEITNSIGQVSAGAQQQAASTEEINAIVSELSSVAEELKKQAEELSNNIPKGAGTPPLDSE